MRPSSFAIVACLLMPVPAFSQSALQEQISSVERAEAKHDAAERAALNAAMAEQKAHAAKELELRKQHQAKVDAQIAARNAEYAREKYREESYTDALRQAQIDSIKLDLEAKKAVVKRTDDFIDQDLKAKAARTDTMQSTADATRSLANGVSEKLKSEGRAEEKKSKGFWDF